jgi:DNA-binding PadR family transcriptional regulator
MPLSSSEMLFIKIVGKYGALSPKDVYEKLRKEAGCVGMAPAYSSAIYNAKNTLREKGYIEKVKEEKVKAISKEFYNLTEKGREMFAKLDRFYLPLIECIPSFEDAPCKGCERTLECWEDGFKMLNETLAEFQGKTPIYREEKMKELFRTPACLAELVFWLRMLKTPQRILKEKFKPILSDLGIDVQKTTPKWPPARA